MERKTKEKAEAIHATTSTFLPSSPLWKQSSSPAVRHIWSLTASGRVGIRLKLKWDTSKACSTCKHQGSNWLSATGRINLNMFPHSTPTVLECQLQNSHLNTAKNQGVETHSPVYWLYQPVEMNLLPALWQRAIIPQIICTDWWKIYSGLMNEYQTPLPIADPDQRL